MRIKTRTDSLDFIYSFAGQGIPLTLASFMNNPDSSASNLSLSYADKACAGYAYIAKNNQGTAGAADELAYQTQYFDSIEDIDGKNGLIPGMQIFQGRRKSKTNALFYANHIGVYAGKYEMLTT